ncbi:hypothetical protein [Haloarchaeobius amylolyticus]|uniref:hypothetical protein n=1 Tax=Haloarchaeobius amylolyticus TaxID=1198296 RepID=UPI00226ECA11|nr:hypothetical protein [Haloarchaeobius amylolyticus]
MSLANVFDSTRTRQASALSMLAEAGMALWRGKTKVAALFLGAAAIAYRWSALGFAAEGLIRLYRRSRTD